MTLRFRKRRNATFQQHGRAMVRSVKRAQREERRGDEAGLTWQEKAALREGRAGEGSGVRE